MTGFYASKTDAAGSHVEQFRNNAKIIYKYKYNHLYRYSQNKNRTRSQEIQRRNSRGICDEQTNKKAVAL